MARSEFPSIQRNRRAFLTSAKKFRASKCSCGWDDDCAFRRPNVRRSPIMCGACGRDRDDFVAPEDLRQLTKSAGYNPFASFFKKKGE